MKGYDRDNVKLSYIGEPAYYINEKKRTVTCKLRAYLFGPVETKGGMWTRGIDFPYETLTVTSTAYCHKGDKFDIERGKRVALSKAENELYSTASLKVSEIAEKLDFLRDACNDFFKKSIRCQAHNIDYIDSLTMPAHPRYHSAALGPKRGIEMEHIKA